MNKNNSDCFNDNAIAYCTSNSESSSYFHHWPLLALLVALVLH